jgi:hypothetical protein
MIPLSFISIVGYKFKPFDMGKNGIKMEREARVYWVCRPEGEKDLLIFDAGYEGGPSISMSARALQHQIVSLVQLQLKAIREKNTSRRNK